MLAKCASPACAAKFRYLHEGKLFCIEYGDRKPTVELASDFASAETPRDRQYFWLCSSCSWDMTVQSDGKHGVTVVLASVGRFNGLPDGSSLASKHLVPGSEASGERYMNTKNVIDVLRQELDFVQKGGYRSAIGWRPPLVFEDSPICTKLAGAVCPSCNCVLLGFVPKECPDVPIPCRHIPLNDTGETLESLYKTATNEELENVLEEWLHRTIAELERRAEARSAATGKAA